MRHRKNKITLSRTPAERKALVRKMAISFFKAGKMQTTAARARFLRGFVEPLITKAKPDTLTARRYVIAHLGNADAAQLVLERAKKYVDRPGGYTRVTKLTTRRAGDAAPLVQIEFV
jgi:large subunit ribosomal protein L17